MLNIDVYISCHPSRALNFNYQFMKCNCTRSEGHGSFKNSLIIPHKENDKKIQCLMNVYIPDNNSVKRNVLSFRLSV